MFLILLALLLASGIDTASADIHDAEKWSGENILEPVSAPGMVLEAVKSGRSEGTEVSIGNPTDTDNHKWVFKSRGDGWYSIYPSYASNLVLTAKDGGKENGTRLILAEDKGLDYQLWSVKTNSNGKLSIISKHAQNKGIDDFGGGSEPGAKIDLWDWNDGDEHLQWNIRSSKDGIPLPVPRGSVIEGTFNNSRIFPGTVRQYWVYIPKQYDPTKPACLYVQQDGFGKFESRIFDTLIAHNEMPITVGIFINPGYLPAPAGKDTFGRPNRNFEYDALGEDYLRFLTDEIIPYIADKEHLNLSSNGNDRCIGGGSSGGICAFNAAWERPDAFARVYAVSGSFVGFRGGNEFPILVRKYEPKPIRAYLTTGTHDMENCAGDWTLIDLEMEKSLRFSGYDYEFHEIEGGHGVSWGPSGLEAAMRFLWKEWPEPVKAGAGAPRVQDILIPGEQWNLLADDYKDISDAACNSKGEVFFIEKHTNRIYRIGLDDRIYLFIHDAGYVNSLTFGPDDELLAVSSKTEKLIKYDLSGKGTILAEGIFGNHIISQHDGSIYVTSPSDAGLPGKLWLIKDGKKTVVDSVADYASGLAISPDKWLLAVADEKSKWIYSYQINDDGTLSNRERFFRLYVPDGDDDAGTGSLCYDKEGHLFAATRLGIQVCADYGPVQVIIPVPKGRVTGVCMGGSSKDTLFAFCGDRIYARKVKTHAIGAFTPFTKMTPGQL